MSRAASRSASTNDVGFSLYTKLDPQAMRLLLLINSKQELLMSTQAELATQLSTLVAQVVKSRNEIINHVAAIQAALDAAGNTSADVDAALAALRAELQITDDLIPDAP